METDKQYDGYESYNYLSIEDYRAFDLPEMHAGFESYEVPLDNEEENRAKQVSRDNIIVSAHDHPIYFPKNIHEDTWDYIKEGRIHTPYKYLAQSNLDAVFDMHLNGLSGIHSKHGWKWNDIIHDVGMRACDIAHSDAVIRIGGIEDIQYAHNEGKVGLVPALESSMMIENELDRIEILYGMGIRSMGITYDQSNTLGTGEQDVYERDGGLTAFGVEALKRMNNVGMAISTSHSSVQTSLDACKVSEKPVLDTHVLAEGASGERGASDEELQAVADTGGVVGVIASSIIPDFEFYMEHFKYMVELIGIDHVVFGPDVLYGDHRGLIEVLSEQYPTTLSEDTQEHPYVKGLENPTEAWQNIVRWLVKEGYSDDEIEKVLGRNLIRTLEEIWI